METRTVSDTNHTAIRDRIEASSSIDEWLDLEREIRSLPGFGDAPSRRLLLDLEAKSGWLVWMTFMAHGPETVLATLQDAVHARTNQSLEFHLSDLMADADLAEAARTAMANRAERSQYRGSEEYRALTDEIGQVTSHEDLQRCAERIVGEDAPARTTEFEQSFLMERLAERAAELRSTAMTEISRRVLSDDPTERFRAMHDLSAFFMETMK